MIRPENHTPEAVDSLPGSPDFVVAEPGSGFSPTQGLYGLYERRLARELRGAEVPAHIGIMMDGNRRWARQLGLASPAHGHRACAAKMQEFLPGTRSKKDDSSS